MIYLFISYFYLKDFGFVFEIVIFCEGNNINKKCKIMILLKIE